MQHAYTYLWSTYLYTMDGRLYASSPLRGSMSSWYKSYPILASGCIKVSTTFWCGWGQVLLWAVSLVHSTCIQNTCILCHCQRAHICLYPPWCWLPSDVLVNWDAPPKVYHGLINWDSLGWDEIPLVQWINHALNFRASCWSMYFTNV